MYSYYERAKKKEYVVTNEVNDKEWKKHKLINEGNDKSNFQAERKFLPRHNGNHSNV